MQREDLGLSKPTRKQKIVAAIVNAQARSDMQAARRNQVARERLKRRARKTRKRQVENMRSDMNKREPSSDAE